MSDIVTIYKYVMDLKTNEITVTPFIATKNDYKTHSCYILKKGNYLLFSKRLNFSIIKHKDKLIAWSLSGDKVEEFKENCRIKIANDLVKYKKYKVYEKYVTNGGIKLD